MIPSNILTADERDAGFRLLFDGKTLTGWRTYNSDVPDIGWRVTGDTLMFHPAPDPQYGHDIITTATFSSFELRLQWKLWEVGNSGIMYHVREAPGRPCFHSGPEYQLLDDQGHPDAKNGPDRYTGACYGLYPTLAKALNPVGEWNDAGLIVDGDHVQHILNGTLMTEYTLGSDDWNRRVASSKFANWPSFASERTGHLLLQDHLCPVAFRSIRVREI